MQLDRTLIAVRERGVLDILDLSLHVLRLYARPIALTFLLGAVPLAVVNFLLIGWIPDFEMRAETLPRYVWLMLVLVYFEAPLAGAFTTTYLGKAVFMQTPSMREVARDVSRSVMPLIWTQLILRGSLPAWLLLLSLDRYGEFQGGVEVGWLLLLALAVAAIRAFRPYISEVVLLEKNPLFSKSKATLTVAARSSRLHTPNGGEVFTRWFTCSSMGLLLTLSVCWTVLWFPGMFTNNWSFGPYMAYFGLPLGLWLVACYFTVVRFLNYLDLRIRQEGWEVELRVRAEAARMRLRAVEELPQESSAARVRIGARVLLLALLLAAALAAPVTAQDGAAGEPAFPSEVDFPWYDQQSESLRRVEVSPRNSDPNPTNPDWQMQPTAPANWNFNWLQFLIRILFWLGIAAIVILILLGIWYMIRAFLTRESGASLGGEIAIEEEDPRRDADRIEQLPFKVDRHNRSDLLAEAKRLYAEGNYRQAIIYLFSFQLLLLDRHHLIRLAKGKTNRQYLREMRGFRRVAELLEGVMVPFEDVFFGDHELDRLRFEGCWNALPEFQQLVEREAPVP